MFMITLNKDTPWRDAGVLFAERAGCYRSSEVQQLH